MLKFLCLLPAEIRLESQRFRSVGTASSNFKEATVRKDIRAQHRKDLLPDTRNCKAYADPFSPSLRALLRADCGAMYVRA